MPGIPIAVPAAAGHCKSGANQFVAVGCAGVILTSPDAVVWTVRNSGTGNTINGVSYTGVQFIAVGDNGTVLISLDGANWTIKAL
jgi:hypothetical protein